MAISRPPNDNRPLAVSGSVNSYTVHGGTTYNNTDISITIERSLRPTYDKGASFLLPGGDAFRRATNYTHRGWKLVVESPAVANAISTTRGENGKPAFSRNSGTELWVTMSGNPSYVLPDTIPLDMRNEAVTKALNKISDQKINLGENLATFGQTLRMFTSRSGILLAAMQVIRRKKEFRHLLNLSLADLRKKGPLNKTAELYLEYVYGLKPLMNDVYTAHELLKNAAGKTLLLHGRGASQRTSSVKGNARPFTGTNVYFMGASADAKVRCDLWARIDPSAKGIRALNQFGLANPLALAWELVGYSFVVDWFLPVGPVLNALTAPAGLLFVGGSIAYRKTELQKHSFYARENFGQVRNLSDNPGAATVVYEAYRREIIASWPQPGLWLAPDPFSGDRPLKALALAILALKT